MVRSRTVRSRTGGSLVATLVAAIATIAVLGAGQVAAAQTVPWTGNGTTNGFCTDNSANPVTSSAQVWLFILTSPDAGPWTLTTVFQNSSTSPVSGEQQGNGSVHFFVTTSVDDKLLSASATNGTETSVLTVSDCTPGTAPPTTTTTVLPGDQVTVAGSVAQAPAATAVAGAARFTG